MVAVTYNAKAGDPVHTVWHGMKFEHGKPTDVPADHEMFKTPVDRDGKPIKGGDGKPAPSPVEANDWFSTPEKKAKPKDDKGEPETPAAYFAYANGWISQARTSGGLKSRWDSEQPLRDKIGWGSDDQERMDDVMRPKFEALKTAEKTI